MEEYKQNREEYTIAAFNGAGNGDDNLHLMPVYALFITEQI